MRKLPYERFVTYLLLARNKYASIRKYLSSYKIAELDGRFLRTFEHKFKKLANPEELGYIDSTPLSAKAESTDKAININNFIPDDMARIALELGIEDNPFDQSMVRLIFENILLRRTVEVYLTTRMDIDEICGLVNERFRLKLVPADIKSYQYWIYNLNDMAPDDIEGYFEGLPSEEQDYKRMAYSDKEDYIRWKMQNDCNIDKDAAVRNMMADAFFNFKETINAEGISHQAAKIWSDIFFKALDYINKSQQGGTTDDIFAEVKFHLVKDDTRPIVPFSELIGKSDEKKKD